MRFIHGLFRLVGGELLLIESIALCASPVSHWLLLVPLGIVLGAWGVATGGDLAIGMPPLTEE